MEAALIALLPFSVPVWIAVVVSYSVITVVNFLVDRTLADILVHVSVLVPGEKGQFNLKLPVLNSFPQLVNNTERNRRLRRPSFLNSNFFVFQIFVEQSVAYRSAGCLCLYLFSQLINYIIAAPLCCSRKDSWWP